MAFFFIYCLICDLLPIKIHTFHLLAEVSLVLWCSGYHVCFTRRRSRVRTSSEPRFDIKHTGRPADCQTQQFHDLHMHLNISWADSRTQGQTHRQTNKQTDTSSEQLTHSLATTAAVAVVVIIYLLFVNTNSATDLGGNIKWIYFEKKKT